jgi:outer membrane murein-binding lipoprotein Lpp
MATSNVKIQCFSCCKETRTFICAGCSQHFCLNDLTIHLQKLREDLDKIENEHDQFRQKFNDQKEDPKQCPLIKEVDQWEEDSINKIKQTAEQCRKRLINYKNIFIIEIEKKLNDLAKEIIQIRQENQFNEIDLDQFKEKLNKLKEELDKPSNVSIEQQPSSFINKIFLPFPPIGKGNQI